jgi:hypothetical protein
LTGAANYESVKENLFPVYVGQPPTIRKDITDSPRSHALLGRFVTVHRDAHGCKFVEFSGTSGAPAISKLPNAAVNKSLCRAVALLCHSTAACRRRDLAGMQCRLRISRRPAAPTSKQ